MTKNQAIELAAESGLRWHSDEGLSTLGFSFVDSATFCAKGGQHFNIVFDRQMLLQKWTSEPWDMGC
jgi:hypothetical protein